MPSGPQLLVLQACNDVPGDPAGFVDEAEIADRTRLQLRDVRDCIESLDEKGYVTSARLTDRYKARITAEGRLVLRQHRPFPDEPGGFREEQHPVKVVPKGLRSFDAEDKDFFLELLPGPRRGDGLPESVHFWKLRIEEMDPDKTFRVGYIFGPSGCGKSSLVKAGLLPRLSKSVIPVYMEATAGETEARLLRGLRKHIPDLPPDLDLQNSLIAVKERMGGSKKVILVIDQFEQWLHANWDEKGTELVSALSECDGGRVQAILLIRDDFSMALYRFMDIIGVKLDQNRNLSVVDLFDLQHARKVLIAFGRGYGMLPDDPKEMTGAQNEFLNRTMKGLSQEGRVISVRLALFAEMLKGKPWTPETLKQVGGAEGVGVTFLEETLSARTAPPLYRIHQKAAQAVLRALLPETGFNIKGNMRSYDELLVVSGYGSRPNEFDELLRILNSELRLISPIEPEGSENDGQTKTQVGEKFFLLTHDYLVPSIREWLTRKQKETRRGRAELRLAERSALWNAKPENRLLPSFWEWVTIGRLTRKKDWTDSQRRMMKRAGRVYGLWTLGVVTGLVTLVLLGLDIRRRVVEANRETVATGLVDQVVGANIAQVPNIVRSMGGYRRWVDPALRQVIGRSSERSPERLHAGLALLPVDDGQVEYLFQRLLSATEDELPVLRDALKTHQSTLTPKLWTVLETAKPDAGLLPAASALASYDPDNARWESAGGKVSQALVSVNSIHLTDWLKYLTDVRSKLTAPLASIFRDRNRSESDRAQATDILTLYASDDLDLITNLLMDADHTAYAAFFPIAQKQAAKTLPLFEAEIRKQATFSWDDPPLDPAWTKPDTALAGKIEMGEGMLTERFAFCQTTALDEFLTTAEGLRNSGYRPIRFRPYADGNATRVAAVWTRDGRPWRLAHDQSADKIREADERNRKEDFIPVDVAADEATTEDGKPTNRHTALWVKKAAPGDDAGMAVPAAAAELQKVQAQFESAGMAPLTLHVIGGDHGLMTDSGVWHKTGTETSVAPQPRTGLTEADLPGVIAQQGGTLIDLGVNAAPRPPGAKERASVALKAAEITLKAKPDDLKARYSRATACMQLGEYQKSIDDLNALIGKAPQFAILFHQFRAIAHARLGHKDEARADLERYQKSSSTKSSKLYLSAVVAAEVGEGTNQAFEALEAALKNQPKDAELHYDAARAYALASQATAKRDQAKGKAHAERAVSVLQAAVRNGYSDYNRMQEDADLDPIRGLPAFAEILKADHLDRRYTVVWSGDVRFEANPIVGLDPTAHLQRCRELESQGYRMVALSVARTSPEGPPVTASVWHRPVITEQVKDQLAERQARAAVALLRMGKVDEVLPLLQHSRRSPAEELYRQLAESSRSRPQGDRRRTRPHPGNRQADPRPGSEVQG